MFYPNLTRGCTFGTSETGFGYGFDRLLGLMASKTVSSHQF